MIKINVITNNINWHHHIKNPSAYLDRKIKRINFKIKKFKKKILICSLLLSDNREIKKLNKKFRRKNKTTDVLSFPFYTKKEFKKKLTDENEIYVGDIIINFDMIKSKKVNKDFKVEFDKLWIHGLVHLFGYDHKKDKDFYKMKKIEKKYFKIINV